ESPLGFEAQLGEERDSGIERLDDDADVVHPLQRHAAIVADRNCAVRCSAVYLVRLRTKCQLWRRLIRSPRSSGTIEPSRRCSATVSPPAGSTSHRTR